MEAPARTTRRRSPATSSDPNLFTRYEVSQKLGMPQEQVRNFERAKIFHPTHRRAPGQTQSTLYTQVDLALAQVASELHNFLGLRGEPLARLMEAIVTKRHRFQPGTEVTLVLDKNADVSVLSSPSLLEDDLRTRPASNITLVIPLDIPAEVLE